ncbi:MAG: phospho-sugar mutase [Erysipelotrichaceae bacterium]|jgi:phosphoglucomutase|nr:phospho-sugar mutase [Bacilli bacterium]NLV28727.1 phospho-sugar mutase [Erysipelotrichaceae bacterium]
MTINDNYQRWLNSPIVSLDLKETLKKMSQEEIDDAFFKDVEFGTAGMRGILGPGTNRLNIFTIRRATVGFALYVLEKFPDAKKQGVVISHDNRHQSRSFTLLTAQVLNDFGINTFIFDSLRPTPELSFAVRYLKTCGGVMITASHNPKNYNGFKVYDETGCQLIPQKIERLVELINSLPNELNVTYEPVTPRGVNQVLDHTIDDVYVELVKKISINPDLPKEGYKIVFTPNHGTSYVNTMRIFNDFGYDVTPVLSQIEPDPDFSGTLSPNPEDPRSYIEPVKLAQEIKANLVVMTDPDGDRVGLAYLASDATYKTFTGNQSAALLIDYIFSERKKKGLLSKDGVMYSTIVSSSLGRKIAESYGVKVEEFLTGFKFIGNRIDYYEKHGGPHFEFGYEESYGCLISPFARDKDGCQAILLYCEMALFYHLQGKTLDIVWKELNERFGWHVDKVFSIEFTGPTGFMSMNELMAKLHDNPPKELDGVAVVKVEDYLKQLTIVGKETTPINLPQSDVVKLFFADGNIICVRPSGTEPKVKFYFGIVGEDEEASEAKPDILYKHFKEKLGI